MAAQPVRNAAPGVSRSPVLGPVPQHCLGKGAAEIGCGVSRSVWKNQDGKTVRRSGLAKQYNSRPVELSNSPAFRVLSRHAHLALARVELELRQHGGHLNGKLIVTTLQFIEYGIERRRIPEALRELDALGIIRITVRGRGGNADHRHPNRFLLNYQCGAVDAHDQITNAWNRFKSLGEAEEIAAAARAAKDPHKVAYSRRNAGKTKNISHVPKKHFSGTKTVPENGVFPGTKTTPTGPGTQTVPTIDISGGGGGRGGKSQKGAAAEPAGEPEPVGRKVWTTPVLTQILCREPAEPISANRSTAATPILATQSAAEPARNGTAAGTTPQLDDDLTIPGFLRRTILN